MMNENNYTLTLSRLEVCDLLLACTHVKWDMIDEMRNDTECPQYRREVVLPQSIKKWEALHDKIDSQLKGLDVGAIFCELAEQYKDGKIQSADLLAELKRRASFII